VADVLRSSDVRALKSDSYGVLAMVTKALVPQRSIIRCAAITFVSKEGSELTGKGMTMRKVVVHDEDEASMRVIGNGLPDCGVVEAHVVPFLEILLGDNALCTTLGHVKRVSGPNVELTSLAILVGKVELNEPVTMNLSIDAFDVDGVVKFSVTARDERTTVGLEAYVAPSSTKRSAIGVGGTKAMYAAKKAMGDSMYGEE
jgi:hypothetical protein